MATEPAVASNSERVDAALVSRGIARSRAVAREYLDAGRISSGGTVITKASTRVADTDPLELAGEPERYPGRAAHKLLRALELFAPGGLRVASRRCLDVGASTGGFTQVLLENEASLVVALDVGHGQLVEALRTDPRVQERSGTNIRDVSADDLGGAFEVVVADLSFISITLVLQRIAALATPEADLVLLIKPQFELGRERLARDGVVRSAQQRAQVVTQVIEAAARHGLHPHGLADSPITGGTGNHEYLLWCAPRQTGMMTEMDIDQAVRRISEAAPLP
ncbi:TlyA family RNA methyltransferase [Dermacoccaceae bacterium W4C1]